jgi:hypothetical protein
VTRRVADRTGDLAAASKEIVDRVRIIYNESRKVVEKLPSFGRGGGNWRGCSGPPGCPYNDKIKLGGEPGFEPEPSGA